MKISFVKYLLMILPSFLALILITTTTYQSSIKSVGRQEIRNKQELINIINWNSEPIYITFIREVGLDCNILRTIKNIFKL
jgi:hypothetical protein